MSVASGLPLGTYYILNTIQNPVFFPAPINNVYLPESYGTWVLSKKLGNDLSIGIRFYAVVNERNVTNALITVMYSSHGHVKAENSIV